MGGAFGLVKPLNNNANKCMIVEPLIITLEPGQYRDMHDIGIYSHFDLHPCGGNHWAIMDQCAHECMWRYLQGSCSDSSAHPHLE